MGNRFAEQDFSTYMPPKYLEGFSYDEIRENYVYIPIDNDIKYNFCESYFLCNYWTTIFIYKYPEKAPVYLDYIIRLIDSDYIQINKSYIWFIAVTDNLNFPIFLIDLLKRVKDQNDIYFTSDLSDIKPLILEYLKNINEVKEKLRLLSNYSRTHSNFDFANNLDQSTNQLLYSKLIATLDEQFYKDLIKMKKRGS